jgi:outer membrane biosynthesis protein TonB
VCILLYLYKNIIRTFNNMPKTRNRRLRKRSGGDLIAAVPPAMGAPGATTGATTAATMGATTGATGPGTTVPGATDAQPQTKPSESFLPDPPPLPPPAAPPKPAAPVPEPPPTPSFLGKIANIFKKNPAEQQPQQTEQQPEQNKGFFSKLFSSNFKWFGSGGKTKRKNSKKSKHSKKSRKH